MRKETAITSVALLALSTALCSHAFVTTYAADEPNQGRNQPAALPQEAAASPREPEKPKNISPAQKTKGEKLERLGHVTWVNELIRQGLEITLDEDAPKLLALVTEEGKLYPIMKEGHGRAFYQDPRLRDRAMKLVLRQWQGIALVQVLDVYSMKDGKRHHVDYWCDVCAILTYDMRLCPCCQNVFGPMRLREDPVE